MEISWQFPHLNIVGGNSAVMESLNEFIVSENAAAAAEGSNPMIMHIAHTNSLRNELNRDEAECENQLCRLCANSAKEAVYIFSGAGREQHLADKINQCLPVSVKVTDLLPKQLCAFCNNKVNICYSFAEKCVKAEEKLKQMMELGLLNAEIDSSLVTSNYMNIEQIEQTQSKWKNSDAKIENYYCPLCSEGHMVLRKESTVSNRVHSLVSGCNVIVQSHSQFSAGDPEVLKKGDTSEPNGNKLAQNSITLEEKAFVEVNNIPSCRFCAYSCPDWSILLKHISCHKRDDCYPCILCNSTFASVAEVEQHLKTFHFDIPKINDSYIFQGSNNIFKCNECMKMFLSKEKFDFHLKFHSMAKHFTCTQCGDGFLNEDLLFNHMTMIHGETGSCSKCGTVFVSQAGYYNHQCQAPKLPFRCKICGKEFNDSVVLRKHKATHSLILAKPFECNHCNASFSRISKLNSHVEEHHGKPTVPQTCYKCCTCCAVFSSLDFAILHCGKHAKMNEKDVKQVEEIEVSTLYCCEFCDASFTSVDQSKQHRLDHVGTNKYGCTFCNLVFYEHNLMKCHKKYHLESQGDELSSFSIPTWFVCEWCEKTFATWKGLQIHYNSMHNSSATTENKPKVHLCEDCGESFNRRSELRRHKMKQHKPQNRFPCEVCGKVLLHHSGLVIHRRQHTGERPFMCDVCGKSFPQGPAMYTHRRTHTRDYPYHCEICSQRFNNKGDLNNHRRSKHTKERPFKCNVCQKSFLTSGVFYQHKQLHAGIRKYKCDKCDRAFSRWNALSIHTKSHTGEKPHHCLVCGRGFAQKGDMKKHMRSQHRAKPPS